MAMALADQGISVFPLAREWNFPTHVPAWISRDAPTPSVIHYHQRVNATGLISATGAPAVDAVIARANESIAKVWHDAFPNNTFWEWRYTTNPTLGSGVGSRGKPLKAKRRLLRDVVARMHPASVLDVGCGDGEATRGLDLSAYTGLDLSHEAIRLARSKRPDGSFHVMPVTDWAGQAELTICLDVLIHQADATEYRKTVDALLNATTRVLLVSGYERPPSSSSPMVHYHEPLSVTVTHADPGVRCHSLRYTHEITTLVVVKRHWTKTGPPSLAGLHSLQAHPERDNTTRFSQPGIRRVRRAQGRADHPAP